MEMSIIFKMRRIRPWIFKEEEPVKGEDTAQLFKRWHCLYLRLQEALNVKGAVRSLTDLHSIPLQIINTKTQRERRYQGSRMLTCSQRHCQIWLSTAHQKLAAEGDEDQLCACHAWSCGGPRSLWQWKCVHMTKPAARVDTLVPYFHREKRHSAAYWEVFTFHL